MDSAAGQPFPYIPRHVYLLKAEGLRLTFATRFNVLHPEKLPSVINPVILGPGLDRLLAIGLPNLPGPWA
jgi:hypothetical protein